MTTLTGSITTFGRQSSTLSSATSGPNDSTSGQSISNFSSLLAALFAAPQILTPNQVAIPVNASSGGSPQQSSTQTTNTTTGQNSSQTNAVDSLTSLLFANSLTNQASASSPVAVSSTSVLGQAAANSANTGLGVSSTLASVANTATSLLQSLAGQANNVTAGNATVLLPGASNGQTTSNTAAALLAQASNVSNGAVANTNATSATVSANATLATNSQSSTTTGLLSNTNQTSLLSAKSAAKPATKPTLTDSLKTALELANSNREAATAAVVAGQLLQTPVIPSSSSDATTSTASISSNTNAITSSTVARTVLTNTNPNLNTADISVNTKFVRLASTSSVSGSTNATFALPGGTVSVVVTPGVTTSTATAANAAVATTTDGVAVSQSTNVLSSPVLNNGRTPGQSVILPALPQSPLVPPAGADAYPNGFYSLTGIDRPADAVTNLDGLKPIDTTAGGSALFARERSDIADLNTLLRGQEPKLQTDNSSVATNGNSFTKQVEVASNPATPTPADQPSRVLTQIADAVAERAQVIREKGSTEIRMRLDPPDLGTIDIRVHSHKGELRADITAADPAVRTMIESQLSDLRSSLEKSGLDFQSFNLNSGNRSDRGGQQPDNSGASAGFDRKAPSVEPVAVTPSAVVTPNRGALLDVTA